jgi:hypothetical protein
LTQKINERQRKRGEMEKVGDEINLQRMSTVKLPYRIDLLYIDKMVIISIIDICIIPF